MKNFKILFTGLILLLYSASALAQQLHVKGTVVEKATGEPVIGATILQVGTTNGTITDFDGNFEFTSLPADAQLQFSYVGMRTITLKAAEDMQVTMEEDGELLEEVVVTGYSTQRKADLTGSVSVVKASDLKTSSTPDPMAALQGKVAGMTVTTSGSPAGTASIRIRGIGSFNSSQDPLYVIDGVPTTSALNSLNANDIESMQVLKDAASASIYGSRAANGVIIITTRKGKKGDKVKVDFNASLTASFYNNQSKMKLLNTKQYATALVQAALNDGKNPEAYASNYGLNINATQGTPISVYNPTLGDFQNYTVNGLYDGFINAKQTMKYSDTDWLGEMSRTGMSQNYDMSVSNATEKTTSLFSVGYKKALGILKYTDFENFSARMNSSYKVNSIVTIGENATITYSDQVDCFPMENALKIPSTVPVYEIDGVTFGGPVGGMSDRQNPMRELYFNRDNRLKVWRIFGNGYLDLAPVKGLLIRSNLGIDYSNSYIHSVNYTFHSDVVNNDTPSATLAQNHDMKWTWSNTAQYDFTPFEGHNFNVLGGMELHSQNCDDFSSYAQEFALETYKYMWPGSATGTQRATGGSQGYKLVSFFGKVDYNWDDLILASFTIRRDGSSRFGKNNRYGTFPAATIGYRLSKTLDKEWLNELKLRASWGRTGNQAISNTARFGLYTAEYGGNRDISTAYDLNLQYSGIFPSGFRASQTANDNLKWETTIQYNLGADFQLFNSEVYGTVDAYIKDIEDMLISPAYLGAMGEGGATWSNGPSLRNIGMELALGYRHTTTYGLSYNINGNLDFFRNHVTYLPETTTGSYEHTSKQNLVESKKPFGSRVGYVVDGLYQTREEVLACGQEGARVGGLKYVDLNGDGRITGEDRTWIFNPVPNFSWGLNFDLSYKNFDFSMFWQGVAGVDVYNDQKFQTDFWSITDGGSNKGVRVLDAWTPANNKSTIPALTTNNTADEGRCSSYFVENGSYAKLRTLQFGYTVPERIVKKAHVTQARFYVQGSNLLTLKSGSLTCSDPENPNWAYPHSSSVSFGVQLGF